MSRAHFRPSFPMLPRGRTSAITALLPIALLSLALIAAETASADVQTVTMKLESGTIPNPPDKGDAAAREAESCAKFGPRIASAAVPPVGFGAGDGWVACD